MLPNLKLLISRHCATALDSPHMHHNPSVPVVLSIAGSDCSSGAGIQADLKTFQYYQVFGLTAVSCVVAENANEVRAIHEIPARILADQIQILLESFPVAAIKTGMLHSASQIQIVSEILASHPEIPVVVDPVMVASTGDSLVKNETAAACQELLIPRCSLLTPNLDEARAFGADEILTLQSLKDEALRLSQTLGVSVLIKGGHLNGEICVDVLSHNMQVLEFSSPRIETPASHGTGCTLSAAVAAGLASGEDMVSAVSSAKGFLNLTLKYGLATGKIWALNQGTTLPCSQGLCPDSPEISITPK